MPKLRLYANGPKLISRLFQQQPYSWTPGHEESQNAIKSHREKEKTARKASVHYRLQVFLLIGVHSDSKKSCQNCVYVQTAQSSHQIVSTTAVFLDSWNRGTEEQPRAPNLVLFYIAVLFLGSGVVCFNQLLVPVWTLWGHFWRWCGAACQPGARLIQGNDVNHLP